MYIYIYIFNKLIMRRTVRYMDIKNYSECSKIPVYQSACLVQYVSIEQPFVNDFEVFVTTLRYICLFTVINVLLYILIRT